MAYFTRDTEPVIVVCDGCLTVEEFDFVFLPGRSGKYEQEPGWQRQQKDPWCWAPRWSMRLTPCDRCGQPVDSEPELGWEPHADCACGAVTFGDSESPSDVVVDGVHHYHAAYLCMIMALGDIFDVPKYWSTRREEAA